VAHGTVEAITIRETRLRTLDNRRVLLANTDIYARAVAVQTAYPPRRTALEIGIDVEGDLERAQTVAVGAASAVDGVLATLRRRDGTRPSPRRR